MPEIGSNYGVIVNKVSKPVLERLDGKKNDFINTMFAGIPENQRCVYTSVSFFEKSTYLEDRENLWLNPEEFKDDQGKPLLQFVYETGMVTNTTPSTNLCARRWLELCAKVTLKNELFQYNKRYFTVVCHKHWHP